MGWTPSNFLSYGEHANTTKPMKKMTQILMMLALLVTATSHAATLTILHGFGPDNLAYMTNAIEKIATTGTLPVGPATSITDARIMKYVTPDNVMLRSDGQGFVWCFAVLTAGPGEMVSLSTLTATLTSSDSLNRLGKTKSFSSANYALTAPGIRKNGTRITSDSSTNQVDGKVIVAIGFKSFGVSSFGDEEEVRNWFYESTNFNLTSTVSSGGISSTSVLQKLPPEVNTTVSGGRFIVSVPSGRDMKNYEVLTASMVTGPWVSSGSTIRAGGPAVDLGSVAGRNAFFVHLAP